MKQVFTDAKCALNNEFCLDEKQAHHIFDVLRTRENETIRVICDDEVFLAHPAKNRICTFSERKKWNQGLST
ncbi:RNA methyltransferase PUA domain-containing protein [uncultured Dubosiella sp.]|uniref:RNA methyltransferase PUA domain-containing protein n=1 Tax=uncultured Dubosiella sp. TaxID=1937011 RepID=UPI0025B3DAD7|nr:RNA methyltransferase PUA domain-containing protein [uncultured Dubosiella sp.]